MPPLQIDTLPSASFQPGRLGVKELTLTRISIKIKVHGNTSSSSRWRARQEQGHTHTPKPPVKDPGMRQKNIINITAIKDVAIF